jgi:dTDP-4-dehydrorhamnose reductase
LRKRRILITGASGLLGLNTALEAAGDHQVFGQVNSHRLKTCEFEVVQADLLAPQAVPRLLDRTQPDWVIHCAAMADIDACERDPQQAHQINSEVPRELARHVARGGARLLHVSTDAIFDGRRGGSREQDSPNPLSVYARTKLSGEISVAEENPQALIVRVNLFGWSASGRRSLAEFFFNRLSSGQECMGFTDVLFCPMLANDLGQVFMKMLDLELSGVFHAVGSECTSKYDFGRRIAVLFGFNEKQVIPTSVRESGLQAARAPNLTLDTTRLKNTLGEVIPGLSMGLVKFFSQFQQGYPQRIKEMIAQESEPTR